MFVVFQLVIRKQDLLERILEECLLLLFKRRQEMVDPQQEDLWCCLRIFKAVLLSLRDAFSLYVEAKNSLCTCHGFCQSIAAFLSRPILSRPLSLHLVLVHHPLQIIPQVSSDIPRLFVPCHQLLVPWLEVSVELFTAQDGSLEPRMVQHLLSRQPLLWISNKQSFYQILKGCRKGLCFSLELTPKEFQPALSDQVVLLIGYFCVFKRRDPHEHQEENNSSCKHIHLFSFIQEFMDLRRYVAFRSSP